MCAQLLTKVPGSISLSSVITSGYHKLYEIGMTEIVKVCQTVPVLS